METETIWSNFGDFVKELVSKKIPGDFYFMLDGQWHKRDIDGNHWVEWNGEYYQCSILWKQYGYDIT